jgi:hypothetical protein
MSGTAITILCMTPAAVVILLFAMSMLENLLLDSRHGVADIPPDVPSQWSTQGEIVLQEPNP